MTLALEDGTPYPEAGSLQFSEVSVDPTTGSVLLRAEFPNRKHTLLPGMFVRATLGVGNSRKHCWCRRLACRAMQGGCDGAAGR